MIALAFECSRVSKHVTYCDLQTAQEHSCYIYDVYIHVLELM